MYICTRNYDLKRGGTFETTKAGTFHSVTAGTLIPLFTLKRMLDRIMYLTLFTRLLRLSLNCHIFFWTTSDSDGINFLMRLAVPFVESWEIDSMLCAALGFAAWLVQEFLYRDILRKALSLDRTLGFAAYSSLRVLRKVSFYHFTYKTSKLTAY